MIINGLLFIIILIFTYETFQKLTKLKEEYFTQQENYTYSNNLNNMDNLNNLNDITKTIAINCKNPNYPQNKNMIMKYKKPDDSELDTPYYARFKPLEYDSKRKYYYRRDILIPEGYRRSADDDKEIARVKALFDAETDPIKKEILQTELDQFKWRENVKNIGNIKNIETGEERSMRDIITDYYPNEIGMSRIWQEPHSHIPNYYVSFN